ncbi:pyridoxamine 5'-phosphate oxidase family protein [Jeotgalibacillus sp. ET6]|uniref:pyridoxamine 5'-phosphate oxidase family protein n=1 Tax=Jeotgalibacillus sp. ET6 TaxID=3037260 RepID=UPI002418848D|nr:pyridoxamine 5'-phosphate oxidase family protein [Jeotgalibacillus sp. ET6]MDG5471906.1 pyridoxamine 5'-phosphate oxidase family protein [Jeotgalibacillus sp. ET6]
MNKDQDLSFDKKVTTIRQLEAIIGEPGKLAKNKVIPAIDRHCRTFISKSPFLVMSTSDEKGRCDASPRGDFPGFVHVLNEKTLIIPERPGNKRVDSMRNLLINPGIGLLFFIPGLGETLRVNGKAQLIQDEEILSQLAFKGKEPLLAIAVEVEECFIHCAKAFRRSGLWDPDSWPAGQELPSAAKMIIEHAKIEDHTTEQMKQRLEDGYLNRLY